MAGTVTDVLNAARSQIGYNGGGTGDNPITPFGAWWGAQTQWCDEFVSWSMVQGGVNPIGADKGFAYVPYHLSAVRAAGKFHTDPAPGDMVFYSWGTSGLTADHIGVVESVNGAVITVIEGNTDDPNIAAYAWGNCCRRKTRYSRLTSNGGYVVGFGRPDYSTRGLSTLDAGAIAYTPPTSQPTPPTPEGFLMALTDAQQAQMYNWLKAMIQPTTALSRAMIQGDHNRLVTTQGQVNAMHAPATALSREMIQSDHNRLVMTQGAVQALAAASATANAADRTQLTAIAVAVARQGATVKAA